MAKTVMVVDDQPGIRLLFKEIIGQDGYSFMEAANGKEALDKINASLPDLLIIDYNLPLMNGGALLKAMEESGLHPPVILMSGLPDYLEEEKAKYGMVKQIFGKPFNIIEVQKEIKVLLDAADT